MSGTSMATPMCRKPQRWSWDLPDAEYHSLISALLTTWIGLLARWQDGDGGD